MLRPCVEPIEIAKPPQVAPHEDKSFLDRIIGKIAVARRRTAAMFGERAADGMGCEGRERIAIASACSLDEVSPHGRPLVPRQHPQVSHYEGPWAVDSFRLA